MSGQEIIATPLDGLCYDGIMKVPRGFGMIPHAKLFLLFLSLLLIFNANSLQPARGSAGSASDLIAAVNALRSASGLNSYHTNNILMGTAQGQSDYMASTGNITHTGPGGTRPKDRAVAAGYGGGATVFISENIIGGTNMSVAAAIQGWQGDSLHLQTMLGPNYRDIGAGVSTSGGWAYYVIDVGYVAGGSSSSSSSQVSQLTPQPTVVYVTPVISSTAQADGSIIHIVRYGQTLITIAQTYHTTVDAIKKLNNLTSNNIYEGQKLIIRLAFTPTPTSRYSPTPTLPPPTATSKASVTPTPRPPTLTPTPLPTPTPTPTPASFDLPGILSGSTRVPNFILGIAFLVFLGLAFMAVGSGLKQKS